ncbi:rho GTPase-activating protein 7 isoform X2 [Brassica rapa]|uniref:rho GTPase-activating protein 7 isoform X2 n=1 Tax=Brassica campestris TaxID=3711 RepID=UPI0004F16C40|nr:rho GTPase-activating protein 7 isoform X2 [Brassica rapa]XP_013667372.2 rho GTPase-activating protein 7 isoform X2 [Brassica napus]
MEASLAALERPRGAASNTVYKSGPLFISSKGLGWTSWKKRWFILTRNSLVFFKNDPGSLPQKGGEVNITLGGIDLNNSGSVVVREDKKLLTVLFPDGRDGRAFTLKAETFHDLHAWKTALEQALAHAPNAALSMGHNGIFLAETNEAIEGRDKRPLKSLVVGRPILLALEDIDGSPSFLEKALQFIEKYGTKIEGILRQAADVEEVERRVQEYEQGKTEFAFDEDPHVIGDCIKHVLRELPSSPVSASCCTALLEAYRIESKEARISSLRSALAETFPEPNRRLLQRILKMMHTISSHSHENRMSPSAVAACMAPLLLRPLLAGECDLDDEFDSGEDNSAQLLAAANAANNAQAIITVLLEDYGSIFDEENIQRCSMSTESHIENEVEPVTDDDDNERALSGKMSESSGGTSSDLYEYKGFVADDSDIESPRETTGPIRNSNVRTDHVVRNLFINSTDQQAGEQIGGDDPTKYGGNSCLVDGGESFQSGKVLNVLNHGNTLASPGLESSSEKSVNKGTPSSVPSKRATFWGRGSARKRSTDGSFDSSGEDELAIQRLETTKNELRQRIAKEARGNAILQASLERRKQALHERRLSLEQDVSRLQEQLQAERDLRAALEVGLSMSSGQFSSHGVDSKTRAELEEIALAEADVARLKQKVAELHHQLSQQRQTNFGSFSDARDSHQYLQNHNPQKRFLQQDFDSTLAFVNHERKQRHEENILGAEWRNSKGGGSFGVGNSRQPSRKQVQEPTNMVDSKSSSGESGKMSVDKFSTTDSPSVPSTSRALDITEYPRPNHPSAAASAALVELTTRLDFFKERRSQLMEQLHSLDLNYGGSSSSSQDFIHRPSSPPWN